MLDTMYFKRYQWRIVHHKVKKKIFGYRVKLFFKNSKGQKLAIECPLIRIDKIKAPEVEFKRKWGFMRSGMVFHPVFIAEMKKKNKKYLEKKVCEVKLESEIA